MALIHLRVLLLNKYEISSISEYILFGDNHVQNSGNCKKGAGLTLEGEEAALWLLTSLCTSAKREVEVAL